MLKKKLKNNAKKVDSFIKSYLIKQKKSQLLKPMKYGILSGGKKIRSSIIMSTGKIYKLSLKKLLFISAAVECIHSYSLIHDDLPCMDNDKFRRGKLSTHAKFGESTAVLAGNSLLTLAFEIISDKKFFLDNNKKIDLIKNLASSSGHTGVAGGQELDLKYEKKRKSPKQIINMQRKKTGKLFEFCTLAPLIIAGKSNKEKKNMSKLGEDIGLLFQISDDFLDITGTKKKIGKLIKKDKKKGKSTLISIMVLKKAYKYENNLEIKILRKLKKHGNKAKELSNIVQYILKRQT